MTKKHRRFNLSGGTGWGYKKEQCSRIALFFFNDKARNTADENILYFLLGVQTLSRLVEITRFELVACTLRTYRSTN